MTKDDAAEDAEEKVDSRLVVVEDMVEKSEVLLARDKAEDNGVEAAAVEDAAFSPDVEAAA